MLVVDNIVPGSFAENLLEPGDVVVKVEGKVVTHFLTLEDILDASVGESVTLHLERGGQAVQATVQVQLQQCNTCNTAFGDQHCVMSRDCTCQYVHTIAEFLMEKAAS